MQCSCWQDGPVEGSYSHLLRRAASNARDQNNEALQQLYTALDRGHVETWAERAQHVESPRAALEDYVQKSRLHPTE